MTVTPDELSDYQTGDAQTHLDLALAAVRSYCGWHIAPSQTDDLVLDGSGLPVLALPTLHLTGVADVVDDETELDPDDDDYRWSESGYLVKACGSWSCQLRSVTLTITHGYPILPDEIRAVVMAAASRSQSAPDGAQSLQAGPFSRTMGRNADGSTGGVVLSELEKAVLDRYRLPPLT